MNLLQICKYTIFNMQFWYAVHTCAYRRMKPLKVRPTILAILILSKVISYHKCDINVLTQEIEAFDIHFA